MLATRLLHNPTLACLLQVRRQNADLAVAREQQKLQKAKVLSDQARQQQEQFFRIIDAQIAAADEEAATERGAAEMRRLHKDEVLRQMAENEERRKLERREFLEEVRPNSASLRPAGPMASIHPSQPVCLWPLHSAFASARPCGYPQRIPPAQVFRMGPYVGPPISMR